MGHIYTLTYGDNANNTGSLEIMKCDLSTNTMTNIYTSENKYPSYLSATIDNLHINMFSYTNEYSTQTGSYVRLVPVDAPHVILYNGGSVYGLSAQDFKGGNQGKVYTPVELSTATMSLYMVDMRSVNKIKDDSIEEVKNEIIE